MISARGIRSTGVTKRIPNSLTAPAPASCRPPGPQDPGTIGGGTAEGGGGGGDALDAGVFLESGGRKEDLNQVSRHLAHRQLTESPRLSIEPFADAVAKSMLHCVQCRV